MTRDNLRKYYRTARPGRWYGGIASADCCGCNLRCVFCWSGAPRDNPGGMGDFQTPEHIFKKLSKCADKFGYGQMRISGNEPTIAKEHLIALLGHVERSGRKFILETNGILIGADPDYAKQLSKFRCIHVRVSLKGANRQQFEMLTGAKPEGFDLQLKALENLLGEGVPCHVAAMLSFSSKDDLRGLSKQLNMFDRGLVQEFEEEYVFLYPMVMERLRKAGLTPKVAYSPDGIPRELI